MCRQWNAVLARNDIVALPLLQNRGGWSLAVVNLAKNGSERDA